MHVWINDLIGDTFMQIPGLKIMETEGRLLSISWPKNTLTDIVMTSAGFSNSEKTEEDCIKFSCGLAMHHGIKNNYHMIQGFMIDMGLGNRDYDWPLLDFSSYGPKDSIPSSQKVIFARHSTSCTGRDPKIKVPNKCFDDSIWNELGDFFNNLGIEPIAIGSEKDEEVFGDWKGKSFYGQPLGQLMNFLNSLETSPLVVSVDTGIKFLSSASGLKTFTISTALPSWLIGIGKSPVGFDMDAQINSVSSSEIITKMKEVGFV